MSTRANRFFRRPKKQARTKKSLNQKIWPKRSLGQNFIVDKNIIKKLIDACGLLESETILEIGCGLGALTKEIAPRVKNVLAVDADCRVLEQLREEKPAENIDLIHRDFLKLSFDALPDNIKIIGNLPYYISSPIIEKIIKEHQKIKACFLTVQLEFGKRMAARPHSKDYSALSVFIQYHAQVKMLFKIKNTAFRPTPKVQSCFLSMTPYRTPPFKITDEQFFHKLVRNAFQQRRKTLMNALSSIYAKKRIETALNALCLKPASRPENLSVQDYVNLSNFLSSTS